MPELPEVETVKETLKEKVIGQKINNVNIYHERTIEYPSNKEFINKIINQVIRDVNRRGKWLLFELDDYYLLSHLRMEGKYFFKSLGSELEKHEHVNFILDDFELRYHDTRKFGRMHLVLKDELENSRPIANLGLEPWDDKVTVDYLREKYKNKRLPIKSVLLDQSIIVGIGNIYADEINFLCRLHPLTPARDLSDIDLQNIIDNTRITLDKAIKAGGTTIRSYTSEEGVTGLFQNELYVHSKEGESCPECSTVIVKTRVGGRGTYYCPSCQVVKEAVNA